MAKRFCVMCAFNLIQARHIAGMRCGALWLLSTVARNLDVWICALSLLPDLRKHLLQQQCWINQGIAIPPYYLQYSSQ
jgi:hypothetical protein